MATTTVSTGSVGTLFLRVGTNSQIGCLLEYARPTLLQLNRIGELGELVYTGLNEPGYASVVAVNTGDGVLAWWVVLGVELA